jgi:hypothetical protein
MTMTLIETEIGAVKANRTDLVFDAGVSSYKLEKLAICSMITM